MVSNSMIAIATAKSAEPSEPNSGISSLIGSTKALMPEKGSEGSEGSENYIFEFKSVGAGPPTAIRVRRMLKCALRRFGLKASWVLTPPTPTPEPSTTKASKRAKAK